jgi:hypothetical protein
VSPFFTLSGLGLNGLSLPSSVIETLFFSNAIDEVFVFVKFVILREEFAERAIRWGYCSCGR